MPVSKNEEMTREQRRKYVANNLLAGLNYRDLQANLASRGVDVSIGTIANDVKIILGRLRREQVRDVEAWVDLECRRLDTAFNAIWEKVQNGDLKAIDRLIQLQNQRAKYLGLFKPIEMTWTDDELIDEYKKTIAQLAKALAAGTGDAEAWTGDPDAGDHSGE